MRCPIYVIIKYITYIAQRIYYIYSTNFAPYIAKTENTPFLAILLLSASLKYSQLILCTFESIKVAYSAKVKAPHKAKEQRSESTRQKTLPPPPPPPSASHEPWLPSQKIFLFFYFPKKNPSTEGLLL